MDYERWREQKIEYLTKQWQLDRITEDEYEEGIENLDHDTFLDEYFEHRRD